MKVGSRGEANLVLALIGFLVVGGIIFIIAARFFGGPKDVDATLAPTPTVVAVVTNEEEEATPTPFDEKSLKETLQDNENTEIVVLDVQNGSSSEGIAYLLQAESNVSLAIEASLPEITEGAYVAWLSADGQEFAKAAVLTLAGADVYKAEYISDQPVSEPYTQIAVTLELADDETLEEFILSADL